MALAGIRKSNILGTLQRNDSIQPFAAPTLCECNLIMNCRCTRRLFIIVPFLSLLSLLSLSDSILIALLALLSCRAHFVYSGVDVDVTRNSGHRENQRRSKR